MANELRLSVSATETKNDVTFSNSFTDSFTVTGNSPIFAVKSIATSDTLLDLGAVGTPGYLIVKNLDVTNFITLGGDGSNYFNKLKAEEFGVIRWNGAAIHAKADTGACLLQYMLFPD